MDGIIGNNTIDSANIFDCNFFKVFILCDCCYKKRTKEKIQWWNILKVKIILVLSLFHVELIV